MNFGLWSKKIDLYISKIFLFLFTCSQNNKTKVDYTLINLRLLYNWFQRLLIIWNDAWLLIVIQSLLRIKINAWSSSIYICIWSKSGDLSYFENNAWLLITSFLILSAVEKKKILEVFMHLKQTGLSFFSQVFVR